MLQPKRPYSSASRASHAITLARSSVEPFLQYSARRDLREEAWKAWIKRGENGGKTDNLQDRRAHDGAAQPSWRGSSARRKTLRRTTVLDDTMAKTPAEVRKLLGQRSGRRRCAVRAWSGMRSRSRSRADGENFKIAAWDWRYYAEKERKARYALDEAEVQAPTSPSTTCSTPRSTRAGRLFGLVLRRTTGRAGLSSGRARLGSAHQARRARRPLLRRLLRPALEAFRRLDVRLYAASTSLRGNVSPHRRQRHERGPRRTGLRRRCSPSMMPARCSTSWVTACTACSRTSPTRRSP